MTTLFGDCLGPVGARLPHEKCPGRVTWPRPAEVNPSAPRAPQARPASRLDAGSECQDCGRWLPGERIVCGKCARKRAESRGRKD